MINTPYHVYTCIGTTGKRVTVKAKTPEDAERRAAHYWGKEYKPDTIIVRYRYTVAGLGKAQVN